MSLASAPRAGLWARLAAILVIQAAALGWMIYERAELLRTGTEVRLAVVPIDPRDLFRGDYVTLTYDISLLRPQVIGGDTGFDVNDPIWVTLDTSLAGPAQPQGVFRHRPPTLPGQAVIRGRVERIFSGIQPRDAPDACPAPCTTVEIDYGISQYFVPEGEGRSLETLRNDGRVSVVAAVDSRGRAAIKQLLVDGVVRYQEPLF